MTNEAPQIASVLTDHCLPQLKHAVASFMALTGGPSTELCHIMLKLVDFLDDLEKGRNPSQEIELLSATIYYAILSGLVQHIVCLPPHPELRMARMALDTAAIDWNELDDSNKVAARDKLRQTINFALERLSRVTGAHYDMV